MLSFVYDTFGISIETKDDVKRILVLPGYCFGRTFIFNAFPFITNEAYLFIFLVSQIGGERRLVS